MPTDEHRGIPTDPTTVAVKLTKLEMRMQSAEKSLETLTGEVKTQLQKIDDKLDDLVTVESCQDHEKRARDDTKRWIAEAIKASDPPAVQRGWLERLREKALAITIIGGLMVGVLTGVYQVAKYLARVEAVVDQSTRQVANQFKQLNKREPVKVYVPYDPGDTSVLPTAPTGDPPVRAPTHRRPRSKRPNR
uniref:Uncharacterized protein n=1 Tax=viral metagenome TaxID=1070528 RepID=A0A6H1Z8Y7_9ZZZZ